MDCARREIRRGIGTIEQPLVLGARVTRDVERGRAPIEQAQIRERIAILAVPRAARDIKITLSEGLLMRLHLGTDNIGAHAERLPHRAYGERDPALSVRIIDPKTQRERFLWAEACGGEQTPRLGDSGLLRQRRKISATRLRIMIDAGWYHAICGGFSRSRDALHDEFAIDRHRQRASYAYIGRWPASGIEGEILESELSAQTQLRTEIPSEVGNLIRGQGDHHVELARAIAQHCGFRIFDRHMMNRIELDRRGLMKARIADKTHMTAGTPLAKYEGTIRDDVGGFRPVTAVFLEDVSRHRKPPVHEQIREIRRRMLEIDDHGARIGRAHAERRHRRESAIHITRVTDDVQQRHRGRCRLGVKESPEGPKKIFAGQWLAIRPLQVAT